MVARIDIINPVYEVVCKALEGDVVDSSSRQIAFDVYIPARIAIETTVNRQIRDVLKE